MYIFIFYIFRFRYKKRLRPLSKRLKKLKQKKVMLCQEAYQQHQLENIIVIDSSSNDDHEDDKTNNNFKLKLSSSSSLSSHSSTISSTSTSNRVSTRQSLKTRIINNKESATNEAGSDSSSDIIIENTDNRQDDKQDDSQIKKCLWNRCNYVTHNDNEFMDHIQSKHVYSQKSCKKFRCMWKSCRVYKSESSSFNWLERHVITHVDTKPFQCIINGCKRKFPTQVSLERHVNTHMKVYESPSKQQKYLNQQLSTVSSTLSNDSVKHGATNGCSHQSKSSTNHTSGRKRKLIEASKYLKKAKYKDFIDEFTCKYLEEYLINMSFNNGFLKFKANVSDENIYFVFNFY